EHCFDLAALVQVEHGGARRRGRRLRAGARQRLTAAAGHRLSARRHDAQVFKRTLRREVQPLLLRQASAAFPQEALHAFDGVAVLVEERANAAQKIDVFRPIVAPAAAPLERTNLAELAFPEAQHMLRHVELGRDFADGAKRLCRLFNPPLCGLNRYSHHNTPHCPNYPLVSPGVPLINCFRTFDARKTSTRRGRIGTSCPVFGLRPTRWPLSRTVKLPNEEIFTDSPRAKASTTSERMVSTRSLDSLRDSP